MLWAKIAMSLAINNQVENSDNQKYSIKSSEFWSETHHFSIETQPFIGNIQKNELFCSKNLCNLKDMCTFASLLSSSGV